MCSIGKSGACEGKCQVNCGLPILWVVVMEADKVTFYRKEPGENIKATGLSCCCCSFSAYKPENVAGYLEVALANEEFDRIVFVGSPVQMQAIRHKLSNQVNSRVIAEIPETTLPGNQKEKEKLLNKLMQF